MKIVVDDKIPYIRAALDALADEVVAKPGHAICASDVRDADVLIVRTRTRCDRTLLDGSRVQLVLTATIGFDHIDTVYMDAAGIEWHNCPGCNATSVAQYVRNSLLLLQSERGITLADSTLGIVGVGHVGTAVLAATRHLVRNVLLNDPPREEAGDEAPAGLTWSGLAEVQRTCDIICLHTPLVTEGPHPTWHLVDRPFFDGLGRHAVLLNAGRGEVVDNQALEEALDRGVVRDAVIDTWEGEPDIRRSLLDKVFIGTPHIAGYSADGKANATRMVLTRLCAFLNRPMDFDITPPPLPRTADGETGEPLRDLQLYNPKADSDRLKAHPERFETLRGNYPLRREQA